MLLLALPLLAACSTLAEYTPVGYEAIAGRPALFINSTRQQEVPAEIQQRFMDRTEAALAASPDLPRLMTRREVQQAGRDDRVLWQDYQVLSDALSVVGVGDREISHHLKSKLGVELLVMTQLVVEPCGHCPEGGLVGVVGAILESDSGKLLYRVHLTRRTNVSSNDELGELVDALAGELISTIENAIKPKWHKLRFHHLAPRTQI